MIKLLTEIHPWEFDFEEVFGYLNYVDETILNDFVWFECDDIFFGDDEED